MIHDLSKNQHKSERSDARWNSIAERVIASLRAQTPSPDAEIAASARCDGAVSAGYKPRDKKEKQDKNKSSFRSQSKINLCKSQRDDAVG